MNHDVICNLRTNQGCGGTAKIARLQLRPLQKMVNQTTYNNKSLLLGRASFTLLA